MLYLSSEESRYRDMIMYQIAKYAHLEGQKLLSQIKDIEKVTGNYIKYIKIFTHLVSSDTPVERVSPAARQRINSSLLRPFTPSVAPTLPNINETRPGNFEEVEREFSALWTLMESWMDILWAEMKSDSITESQLESPENSPRSDNKNEGSETNSLRSYASRLKISNPKLFRSISRTSTNVEQQLRLSQPAYTFNNYEDSSLYLPRSESYSKALSNINDHFDVKSSISQVSMLSLNEKDNHILDLTADRLCAVINGYHMYCTCTNSWDRNRYFYAYSYSIPI